jgi:hypothetical protein
MGNGWSKFKGLFWQPAEDDDDHGDADDGDAVTEALSALKDLDGVVGSIAVDASGSVRASDLPRIFDRATIELLGSKMVELRSALTNDAREPISGSLEFEGHSFHVKSFPLGMVGVLHTDSAHKPALAMALNLVSRRVAATLETVREGVEA